jgi:hypothetical protein
MEKIRLEADPKCPICRTALPPHVPADMNKHLKDAIELASRSNRGVTASLYKAAQHVKNSLDTIDFYKSNVSDLREAVLKYIKAYNHEQVLRIQLKVVQEQAELFGKGNSAVLPDFTFTEPSLSVDPNVVVELGALAQVIHEYRHRQAQLQQLNTTTIEYENNTKRLKTFIPLDKSLKTFVEFRSNNTKAWIATHKKRSEEAVQLNKKLHSDALKAVNALFKVE